MYSRLTYEILWWIFTLLVTTLILLPIYSALGNNYPFYIPNTVFIVVFITFTRYIFLVKYSFFADIPWIKVALIFLPIPFFFYSIDALYDFQRFLDEDGIISILGNLQLDDQYTLSKYIRYQKLFFGTGAMVTLVALPLRMIISLWRRKNRGTY